jgi:hypothetical protein
MFGCPPRKGTIIAAALLALNRFLWLGGWGSMVVREGMLGRFGVSEITVDGELLRVVRRKDEREQ